MFTFGAVLLAEFNWDGFIGGGIRGAIIGGVVGLVVGLVIWAAKKSKGDDSSKKE